MADQGESLIDQQKYRALRIDPTYHGKKHPTRTWMWRLSFILPVIAAAVLGALMYLKNANSLYEPGPVSARHQWDNQRCDDCHERDGNKFGLVSNAKCRKCHDGPIHNERQICMGGEKIDRTVLFKSSGASGEMSETKNRLDEPRCATCHTEHKGNQQLVQVSDTSCTQCHMDLRVKEGALLFKSGISNFMHGHPEWRALRKEQNDPPAPVGNDPTKLKFNHSKHMEVTYDKESKHGERKMQCADCHRATESNLELIPDSSLRMDEFVEDTLKPSEMEEFYKSVTAGAATSGLVKYNLSLLDIRRMSVEALSRRDVYAALQKAKGDRPKFRAILERALMDEIRQRFGNTEAAGQKRYMLPITYEKHCASECHTHELVAVNGITPPHGKAEKAREFLSAMLYRDAVQQALGGKSPADKARKPLVKKLRDALEAEAKAANKPIPAGKSEKNKLLVETLQNSDDFRKLVMKALGKEEDLVRMLDGLLKPDEIKEDEKLAVALEKLINEYAGDKPPEFNELDTMVSEKLAEGTKKLFGPPAGEKGACLFCHEPNKDPAEVVIEPNIPVRWLNHSIFNHETHRVIDCNSCHALARSSKETSDVLLPGIQDCQKCHNPKGARIDCIECHIYHDKTHQRLDSTVLIDGLINRGAQTVAPVTPDGPK